jgi:FSR family fosmidomycin resistance protein-like MFS transporter
MSRSSLPLEEPRLPSYEASRRAAPLALFARFADELLFGAADVLRPTLRTALDLSYTQLGLLSLALQYVAAVVEPANGLLIDVWRRKWLLAFGALGIGVATVLVGIAPTFLALLLAFAIYGAGSGPLAHTADVVLVEGHEASRASRIFARATALDTVGALLGPALVTAWLWGGLDWRVLLVLLGAAAVAYSLVLAATEFAPPPGHHEGSAQPLLADLRDNVRAVLADREALYWLVYLRVFYVVEAPASFRAVWLVEQGGMSQALAAGYVAINTACGLLGVLALERWLHRRSRQRVLLVAAVGMSALFPLWFAAAGSTALLFALGAPLAFLVALHWPIARAASLNTASRRPGAVSAVNSVTGLLPVTLAIGALAEVVGLTAASLGAHLLASLALVALAWWMPRGLRQAEQPSEEANPAG